MLTFLVRLLEHPSSRYLSGGWWWGELNANDSASFGPNGFSEDLNEKLLAANFRLYIHLYECVAIFLFPAKLHFSGCKIWVKYVVFWGSYLTNFPMAKLIHIRNVSLNTIELLEKSMIFKIFEFFWEKVIYVKFH